MGAEKIIAKIKKDADERVEAIRREGREQADRIINEGERNALDEYQRILEHGRVECKEMAARIRSQARLDANRIVRKAREDGIRKSFREAKSSLRQLPETEGYSGILVTLIRDGMGTMSGGAVHIISTERDRELIRELLTGLSDAHVQPSLSHECAITCGGVIIVSEDGRISVNNTFEARLERLRSSLVHRVAEILFGSEEA